MIFFISKVFIIFPKIWFLQLPLQWIVNYVNKLYPQKYYGIKLLLFRSTFVISDYILIFRWPWHMTLGQSQKWAWIKRLFVFIRMGQLSRVWWSIFVVLVSIMFFLSPNGWKGIFWKVSFFKKKFDMD